MTDQDTGGVQGKTHCQLILESRQPRVAVRITRRNEDGTIRVIPLGDKPKMSEEVKRAVERIFREGKDRLEKDEWSDLFRETPQQSDQRWTYLVRLASFPQGEEGDLRGQFVALLDGTAFSMRLLLVDLRGGNRRGDNQEINGDRNAPLTFNRLPYIARFFAFLQACQKVDSANPPTRVTFTEWVKQQIEALKFPTEGLDEKALTDRFFQTLKKNGGKFLLPTLARKPRT